MVPLKNQSENLKFGKEYKAFQKLSDFTEEGSYMINNTPSDSPMSGAQTGILIVFKNYSENKQRSYISKIYIATNGTKTFVYAQLDDKSWTQLG